MCNIINTHTQTHTHKHTHKHTHTHTEQIFNVFVDIFQFFVKKLHEAG